ncbi:ArsR/SmtB family transcription factor [Haloglomus salinum]|jgi:DNA-binding transcriptional ArsR family regulator|uniref:ArsR/SmtB family transcription factor n=1 Tax=Haloglomus salinum TaxID=2962673 RepID=UPI0020C96856|nr:winged helix-turn-helix domain-containing protein [Haloglomus salinum]
MAPQSVFPHREAVEREEVPSEAVSLDDAGDVVNALTSETARKLVDRIYAEPGTASDLAEDVDTSLQNVQYHLGRLETAGVVEVVGTWYSQRGNDMDVYGPSNEPLVIVAGPLDSEAVVEEATVESPADEDQSPVAIGPTPAPETVPDATAPDRP